MINISIAEPFEGLVAEELFIKAAQATLDHQSAGEQVEMTVAVETEDQLRQLNHQFLGIDQPTDVLSFPSDEMDPDTNLRYLGDVVLSYEQAQKQAAAAGETTEDELQLLVIHGALHLLGHDHGEPAEKTRMWAAQKEILALLGCKITIFPE